MSSTPKSRPVRRRIVPVVWNPVVNAPMIFEQREQRPTSPDAVPVVSFLVDLGQSARPP
jgi:hypothetical protein